MGVNMSIIQQLKSAIPGVEEGLQRRTYECQDCGNVFTSAKSPNRVECTECLSQDVVEQE